MVVLAVIAPFALLPLLMVMSRFEQRMFGEPVMTVELPESSTAPAAPSVVAAH
jgi:hypothetical protein